MAKPAAEHCHTFDAILRLGALATEAPAILRDQLYLGIRLTSDGGALAEVHWITGDTTIATPTHVGARPTPLLASIHQQLGAWLNNPAHPFVLPIAAPRTPFQARLRVALRAIQAGDTITYANLAKQLHSAPRAVGQALGSNPLPMIVPCHRVISASKNRLTGFNHASEGLMLTLKAWLLEREAHA